MWAGKIGMCKSWKREFWDILNNCDKCTQKERLTVKIYEEMPPGRRRGTTVTKM